MEERQLIDLVFDDLQQRGFEVEISEAYKNNIHTKALTVKHSKDTAVPTVYPEMLAEMYEPGMSIPDLSGEVLRFTREHTKEAPDIKALFSPENILSNTTLVICREDWNREMLQNIIHRHVDGTDLAVYPILNIDDHGMVKLDQDMLQWSGITEDEVMEAAKANSRSEYTVRSMKEVLADMTGVSTDFLPPVNMAVLSNRNSFHGAAAMTDQKMLDKACQIVGTDNVVLIPSSIHEVLVVPADMASPQDIAVMIQDVNDSTVQECDRLSDHPYSYDGKRLAMVNEPVRNRQSGRSR